MRSDDVYEQAARDDQLGPDDELARHGRLGHGDETLATDPMAEGADRMPASDRTTGTHRMDEPMPVAGNGAEAPTPVAGDGADAPLELFGAADVNRFRGEWREIQAKFVDDPQEAVRGADHLVSELMDSLTETFNHHKHELEEQWQHGDRAETEDLRQALRRYRTFFDQLLNA